MCVKLFDAISIILADLKFYEQLLAAELKKWFSFVSLVAFSVGSILKLIVVGLGRNCTVWPEGYSSFIWNSSTKSSPSNKQRIAEKLQFASFRYKAYYSQPRLKTSIVCKSCYCINTDKCVGAVSIIVSEGFAGRSMSIVVIFASLFSHYRRRRRIISLIPDSVDLDICNLSCATPTADIVKNQTMGSPFSSLLKQAKKEKAENQSSNANQKADEKQLRLLPMWPPGPHAALWNWRKRLMQFHLLQMRGFKS